MSVTIVKLLDGPRHAIFHVSIVGDGVDLNDEVLVDPSELTPPASRVTIEQLIYDLVGFSAKLEFESGDVDDVPFWTMSSGPSGEVDFRPFGGFKDQSGLDGDGKVQITTTNLTESGGVGSIILKIRKD